MEIWKDIDGLSGYKISSYGRVMSKRGIIKNQLGIKYQQVTIKRKTYTIHKLVAENFLGKRPAEYVIDHIDNNSLNNKLENLQYTTYKINNTKDRSFNTSYRGVHFCKSKNKWICRLTINKNRIHLGTFTTEAEAIKKIEEYGYNNC
jgi:hypothetical protein